jgi:hypothetical protein
MACKLSWNLRCRNTVNPVAAAAEMLRIDESFYALGLKRHPRPPAQNEPATADCTASTAK